MYLPFRPVTAQEDRIGNLQLWIGKVKPANEDKIAYIQTSQARSDIFVNCFNLTDEDKEELEKGYTVVLQLHEDYIVDIFS